MKKLHIKTFGCQMNVYDSERMRELLSGIGFESTASVNEADVVILNTCHIRDKAAEKVYSELGRLKRVRDERGAQGLKTVIAVAGCVAQAEGAEIFSRQNAVDIVVGPQSYHRLPEMVARVARGTGHALETDFPAEDKFDSLPETRGSAGPSAFLTVQEGCDKFCTFCVVPYTRGAEYSRSVAQIEVEARQLVSQGAREITLLGQNVNAYCGNGPDGERWNLGRLIRRLSRIEALDRIRYTTSHPRDMDAELISAHRDVEKLMPYLHLPVQSGSDRVLSAMNRQHTSAQYRRIVDQVRQARSEIALSSDFIVGFPGETDADFEATLGLVREVSYAQAYSFKYSPRPGTPAASSAHQVPDDVKDARLSTLQALLSGQQAQFNESFAGRTVSVLFEKHGRKESQAVGRSPYLQPVHVDGAARLIGQIHHVAIEAVLPNSLRGRLVAPRDDTATVAI